MLNRCHSRRSSIPSASPRAFTLVELLVVIAIIGVLISILLPSLSKARKQADKVACASNLRQMYLAMQIYSTDNKAWLFPVGSPNPGDPLNRPTTLGTQLPPHERWPAFVKSFGIQVPPGNVQYEGPNGASNDSSAYRNFSNDDQPIYFSAEKYTPKVMICPQDPDPLEWHSYVVNQHLADERIRFGTARLGKAGSSSAVVVAGEKKTTERDYYMENAITIGGGSEFDRVVEPYRHGVKLGSNYLFLDGHVDSSLPAIIKDQLDPWDPNPDTTTTTGG